MTTFSQLVDDMVSETKRPDLVSEISRYLNETIREIHASEDRNATIFYRENYHEDLLDADVESGFQWDIPAPANFQKLTAIKYVNVFDEDGIQVWASETTPGRHLKALTYYCYRVAGTFVFAGYGGVDTQIALGWYEFPRSLKYKAVADRPASYDDEDGWTYADGINTDELELGARELTSNWLLLRWKNVLAEGLRAKVYKRLSDDTRARTSYSMYQALRHGLWTSETAEIYGG